MRPSGFGSSPFVLALLSFSFLSSSLDEGESNNFAYSLIKSYIVSIHKEGFLIIAICALLLLLLNYLSWSYVKVEWFNYLLAFASFVFFILVVQFFRNPERTTPKNEQHIIAPADGKVVIIEDVEEPEYFKGKRTQISIFMSPLNVHVNRSPVAGTVRYYKYHPGKYLVAWHPKSSTLNERTTIVVETENGQEVLFRQIAGAVARRIACYVGEGDTVDQGEEFGFIRFGSRVDVFLPTSSKVLVKLEEKVVGGESVLASFSE
jgi:phosphatidylserine decarboxylase